MSTASTSKRGGRRAGAGRPARVGKGRDVAVRISEPDHEVLEALAIERGQSLQDYFRSMFRTRVVERLEKLGIATLQRLLGDVGRSLALELGSLPTRDEREVPIVVVGAPPEEAPLLTRLLEATALPATLSEVKRFSGADEVEVAIPLTPSTEPVLYLLLRRNVDARKTNRLLYRGEDLGALLGRLNGEDTHAAVVKILEAMRHGDARPAAWLASARAR